MHQEHFTDTYGRQKVLNLRFHRESTMRYKVRDLDSLVADDYKLLVDMIDHHRTKQVPRIRELYDYAEGNNHEILTGIRRRKEEDMADSRAVHNFGGIVSIFKQGFLTGIPIRVEYEDNNDNDEMFEEIAVENDFHELNRSIVLDLSQVGRSYDVVYYNDKDQIRVRKLDPIETFVIFDMTLSQHSVAAVRYYNNSVLGENGKDTIELYTDSETISFELNDGQLVETDRAPHYFGDVPITEWLNNSKGKGDYETVLSLIDMYDASQSDTANYMTDLSDSILAIIGLLDLPATMTPEEKIDYMKKMRRARLMHLVPPTDNDGRETGNVDAKYLYKQYDVAGTEAYKKRIENDVHKFTNTPDLTDGQFAGTQSGEAMKYKLFGLEQEGDNTKASFTKCLKRRYELIANVGEIAAYISDFKPSSLKITFTPNLPKSLKEMIDNFVALEGEVSNETAMRISNIVDDVDKELELLAEGGNKETQLQRRLREAERLTDADLAGE